MAKKKEIVVNGLSGAIMGSTTMGNPFQGTPVSQVDPIFNNLRNYLISNMRQPLSQAYVEIGLVKTVCDLPVDDAMRGGVEIKSKELSPEEVEKLQAEIEQKNDLGIMAQALKWDRLFGGAGVIIVTGQDPEQPLNMEAINENDPVEFRAADMWELFSDRQNIEGTLEAIDSTAAKHYMYYGQKVDKSRVLIMKGCPVPSFIRPRLRGWGTSVVEILVRSINQYLKANNLTYEVLDEFKIDIYKLKNLNNTLLSAIGEAQVRNRIQLANYQKNYQNAITMDSEDDFTQKELSFAGIAETMSGIRMQVASDLRMPLTKLFGISATGFNSGEDDIENYNAMVESTVRTKSKHHIINMVKLRCQKLFGYVPEDITIDFKPLRILSSEQEENVKTQKFARLFQCVQGGLITPQEFKEACNKAKLLEIQVDTTQDVIVTPREEMVSEHKQIVETLKDNPEDKGEMEKQKAELEKYEGKGKTEKVAVKAPKSTTQAPEAKS
jgi:phage-related protein (TIGR01555 family)